MQGTDDGRNPATERRTGDFDQDGRFDREKLLQAIAQAENTDQAADAMRLFLARGDAEALREAIALYTRKARGRGKTVENVLAELNVLSARQRERYAHGGKLLEPSELKRLVLQSVLDGFGDS